jgi:cytochrome c biogenesis protein CcdA/thiol-disulfide isomerase/thioredoxin
VGLLLAAFIAGLLTALAPCVLPVLPVIVGGSLTGTNRSRPYLIVGSLSLSVLLFTLALKATTTLLGVPANIWTWLSGGLLISLGILTVWPHLYDLVMARTGLATRSQKLLDTSGQKRGWVGPVLIGAALGPVFASCSPTFAIILATVLPASFAAGIGYLVVYCLGLGLFLLTLALIGRRLIRRLGWAVNPEGWFKRGLGVIFVILGLAIITGTDKTAENWLTGHQLINTTALEQQFLTARAGSGTTNSDGVTLNIPNPTAAPELVGLTNWLNSNPQTIASLKGKVVVIDFWTYSCINCIHTLPYVEGWYQKYQKDGLVVIGVHAPEFAFEQVPANVAQAVKDDHITYPVAQDNNMSTWQAYSNQYWPAEYFIDRQGKLRNYKFGEGDYDQDEKVIRALLAEGGTKPDGTVSASGPAAQNSDQTPETYLGYERGTANDNTGGLTHEASASYTLPTSLNKDAWGLGGNWTIGAMEDTAGAGATLDFKVSAKQVYLVMGSSNPAKVTVLLNGKSVSAQGLAGADVAPDGTVTVSQPRLYRLVKSAAMLQGATLELRFESGITVNAFTFDS